MPKKVKLRLSAEANGRTVEYHPLDIHPLFVLLLHFLKLFFGFLHDASFLLEFNEMREQMAV